MHIFCTFVINGKRFVCGLMSGAQHSACTHSSARLQISAGISRATTSVGSGSWVVWGSRAAPHPTRASRCWGSVRPRPGDIFFGPISESHSVVGCPFSQSHSAVDCPFSESHSVVDCPFSESHGVVGCLFGFGCIMYIAQLRTPDIANTATQGLRLPMTKLK